MYAIIINRFVEKYYILEEIMEETISLRELFETLKKRMSLIIVITLLAAAISGAMSYFFIKPVYQSSSQILVSQAAAGALASIAGIGFRC